MTRFPVIFFITVVTALALLGLRASFAEDRLDQGDRLAAEGRLDEAITAYSQLVKQRPGYADAHARLGGMRLLRQQYPEAIESFRQAISLDPVQARAFVGMGMAYLHTGRHGLARAALGEARKLKPDLGADIDPVLAWLDSRSGDPDLAGH